MVSVGMYCSAASACTGPWAMSILVLWRACSRPQARVRVAGMNARLTRARPASCGGRPLLRRRQPGPRVLVILSRQLLMGAPQFDGLTAIALLVEASRSPRGNVVRTARPLPFAHSRNQTMNAKLESPAGFLGPSLLRWGAVAQVVDTNPHWGLTRIQAAAHRAHAGQGPLPDRQAHHGARRPGSTQWHYRYTDISGYDAEVEVSLSRADTCDQDRSGAVARN